MAASSEGRWTQAGGVPAAAGVFCQSEHRNLIDTLIYDKNVSMQVARNRLGSFQFIGETQLKTVDMLSGGEKSRLRLV